MLSKDTIGTLISETALYWAVMTEIRSTRPNRSPTMLNGGEKRLDELILRFKKDLFLAFELRQWKQFEKEAASLSFDMRTGIFAFRPSALRAALTVASDLLQEAGFRCSDWDGFDQEFLSLLRNPLTSPNALYRVIRTWFSHPL